MKALFVTGSGTDIGKTYVSALIVKAIKDNNKESAYYKAAMSGNPRKEGVLIPQDALHVKTVSGVNQSLESMCPYVYGVAYSPALASLKEGKEVELEVVQKGFNSIKADYVTVEGSGGILCPINYRKNLYMEDIIEKTCSISLPCIMVCDAGLGTINNVVLSWYYMKSKGLKLKGLIFNNYIEGNPLHEDNIRECLKLTGLPLIDKIKKNQDSLNIDFHTLESLYEEVK